MLTAGARSVLPVIVMVVAMSWYVLFQLGVGEGAERGGGREGGCFVKEEGREGKKTEAGRRRNANVKRVREERKKAK